MLVIFAFWLFLLATVVIVWINGDFEARLFSVIVVGASVLTALAMATTRGQLHTDAVFAVDGVLLILVLVFVYRSHSYWPIWFAGFQTITVATELARHVFPNAIPVLYGNAAAFWSIPALATMAAAVVKDRRLAEEHFGQ